MTPEQRQWCRDEILDVEGCDDPGDAADDGDLARYTLLAWQDYARDKGVIL